VALLAFLFSAQWVVGLSSLQTPLAKGVIGISDRQFGWFQSVWGLGFVGASLLLGWYGRQIARGQAVVLGYGLWALAAGAMGLSRDFPMLLVAGFWVGFANIVVFVNVTTVMMEHTPPDRLGRTITVRQVGVALVRVIALLGFGLLGDRIGVKATIATMAALSLTGTAYSLLRYPALWRYRVVQPLPSRDKSPHLKRGMAEPDWSYLASRVMRADMESDFVASEQRWLNSASAVIVVVGWLVLLLTYPVQAIGMAGSMVALVSVAVVVRWGTDRLRSRPERQGSSTAEVMTLARRTKKG
jgi:MFS family permease